MNSKKNVRAKLTVICDVEIDNDVTRNITEQYSAPKSEEDVATQVLFAWLNPKLSDPMFTAEAEGNWDGVCQFEGRFSNLVLIDDKQDE